MGQMNITSAARSTFIQGDKEIPTHLIQKPINKCPGPIGMPGHPGKPFPIDIDQITKLPGGIVSQIRLHGSDDIINAALNTTSRFHGKGEAVALRGFHAEIENMNQNELDDMKDSLVKRMGSPDSSQTERGLMQKLYEITDAVSEHRVPPYLHNILDEQPMPMPIHPIHPIRPCPPQPRPWIEQFKPDIKWAG